MGVLNYNETDPFPPQPPGFQLIFPHPQLGNVNIYESRARSNYNALQARLERRFANGFSGLVSYTWQQTLTDLDFSSVGVALGAGAGLQTIKDIRANYGPSVFDRPHRLVASWLYAYRFSTTDVICSEELLADGRSERLVLSRTDQRLHPRHTASHSPVRMPIYWATRTYLGVSGRSIAGSTSASSRIRRPVNLAMPAKA